MFPIAFLLRLGVFFILLFFPRGFHFQRQVQWQNPNIQQIKRQKILMEQSRLLGCGLVGRVGQVKGSTVQGAHLQPRLWRRLHSAHMIFLLPVSPLSALVPSLENDRR